MKFRQRPGNKRFKKNFKHLKKPLSVLPHSTQSSSITVATTTETDPQESGLLHHPVMCNEVLHQMQKAIHPNPVFLDATFGRGGHTQALLNAFPESRVLALDCDPDAICFGHQEIAPLYPNRLKIVHSCFSEIEKYRSDIPLEGLSGILMDLGVSSPQLDQAERGFSFSKSGPLDMRMQKQGITAAEVINTFSEENIANILFEYGQERLSRRIAKAIIKKRAERPIATTQDLATLICHIMPPSKTHPATRSFQALRIFVNGELEKLEKTLDFLPTLLKPEGMIVVIAFHSLEDRIVKLRFRHQHRTLGLFSDISKKIITPCEEEMQSNPRSRSACLRFAQLKSNDPTSCHNKKLKKNKIFSQYEGEKH